MWEGKEKEEEEEEVGMVLEFDSYSIAWLDPKIIHLFLLRRIFMWFQD